MDYTLDKTDPEEKVDMSSKYTFNWSFKREKIISDKVVQSVDPHEHPQMGIWASSLCLETCFNYLQMNCNDFIPSFRF